MHVPSFRQARAPCATASGAMHRRDGTPLPRNDSLASGSGSDCDEKTLDAEAIASLHLAHPQWATPIKVLVRFHILACLSVQTRKAAHLLHAGNTLH